MAAILRSALRKTLDPQLRRRLLHTGDSADCTRTADASRVVSSLKSAEIDPIAKKINVIARKTVLVEYIQRTLEERTSSVPSVLFAAFLFIAGYRLGFHAEYQEEGRQ